MAFWKLAFNMKWITTEQLRLIVKTESNLFGEISKEEYKKITGVDI